MNSIEDTENERRLDELLSQAHAKKISNNEFIRAIKSLYIPVGWVEMRLRKAYDDLDIWMICLLVDCVSHPSFQNNPETSSVTLLLCQIMEDPRICGGEVEEIADALGYCHLPRSALGSFVNVCTSPRWDKEPGGWPDFRKVLESMHAMYASGRVTGEEITAAYEKILHSPNTVNEDRGLLSSTPAFLALVRTT